MHYLGIDIKTTGQSMTQHHIVTIGACLIDVDRCAVAEPRDEHVFRAVLTIPDVGGDGWERRCFDEFWNNARGENDGDTPLNLLRQLAKEHGELSPKEAMVRFWAWVSGAQSRSRE